jgi:hypothetical protein
MLGAIPPFAQYVSMARCSVKAQGHLYLYLLYVFSNSSWPFLFFIPLVLFLSRIVQIFLLYPHTHECPMSCRKLLQYLLLLLFISLSTQSGKFWIHPRIFLCLFLSDCGCLGIGTCSSFTVAVVFVSVKQWHKWTTYGSYSKWFMSSSLSIAVHLYHPRVYVFSAEFLPLLQHWLDPR